MDLIEKQNAIRAVEGAVEVYNLAAERGLETHIARFYNVMARMVPGMVVEKKAPLHFAEKSFMPRKQVS